MRLRDAEVVIVGMGLMGGSLGLALKGKCKSRIGVARTRETAEQAVRIGAVDHASTQIDEAVSTVDLIVMSTPVRHIVEAMEQIGPLLKPGAVVTDMGSTK